MMEKKIKKKRPETFKHTKFSVVPAGHGRIRIFYYKKGVISNPIVIITARTPMFEKFMNRKLKIHEEKELYKLTRQIKKAKHERFNKWGSIVRARKSKRREQSNSSTMPGSDNES